MSAARGVSAAAWFAGQSFHGRLPALPSTAEVPSVLTVLGRECRVFAGRALHGHGLEAQWVSVEDGVIVLASLDEERPALRCWAVSVDAVHDVDSDRRVTATGYGPSLRAAEDDLRAALRAPLAAVGALLG